MTLQTLPNPILWPGNVGYIFGTPALTTGQTLDATGEYQGYAFVAKEDMAITHVMFRTGTVTNSPTAVVSIEALDTSGIPTGSAGFGSTNGTTAVLTSNATILTALGSSSTATIPKGTPFCVKITWGGVATSTIITQHMNSILTQSGSTLPFQVTNVSASPVRTIWSHMPIIAVGSSSTTFYNLPGAMPLSAYTAGTFNNTNSAKRGLKFTPPFACRAIGVRMFMGNSTGDYNVGVYTGDASGTELSSSSTAFDGDTHFASNNSAMSIYFDNPVTLTAGTAYRVAIEPTSATNSNVPVFTLPSVDYYGGTPGGTAATYSSLVSGTWTDSTTQIPLMDVIIDQLDNGVSTGGVVGVIGG